MMSFQKNLFFKRQLLNVAALCLSDSIVLLMGLYLGNWIIYLIHGVPISVHYALAVVPVWCTGAIVARVVPAWGIGPVEEFRRIQLLLLTVFGIAGIAVFFGQGRILPSRVVYLVSYLFGAGFVPMARIPVKKLLSRFGAWGCRAAIYGQQEQVIGVIESFRENPLVGYMPHSLFIEGKAEGECLSGVPVEGDLMSQSEQASVAIVPVTLAETVSASQSFDRVFSGYQRVVLLPDLKEDVFLWALPRNMGNLIGLEISSNLLSPFARLVKQFMDFGLILVSAPLWLPLLGGIALFIFLSDHQNPFFIQPRVGRRNRVFRPIKFRTMVKDAEQVLEQALSDNAALREEWDKSCKLRNDPRVTRIGTILRRTSLDELPQLLNVLTGRMSLVGPRPLPDYHHEQLAESVRAPRSRVRPGITGLWQVSGRSDSGTAGMEKWDTYYVRNWSIWLDIIILARTFSSVCKGTGAY